MENNEFFNKVSIVKKDAIEIKLGNEKVGSLKAGIFRKTF